MRESNPNPNGKHGKPFTLAPMKFDDGLRKILAAPPAPKAAKPKAKRPRRKAATKKKYGRNSRD